MPAIEWNKLPNIKMNIWIDRAISKQYNDPYCEYDHYTILELAELLYNKTV